MTTPQRTGDDEGRIVHGGELPEDDGSLDEVVVDKPEGEKLSLERQPDELWTGYFIRRLAYEGIHIEREFKGSFSHSRLILDQNLNSGLMLSLKRDLNLQNFVAAAGSKKVRVSSKMKDLFGSEEISFHDKSSSSLSFQFHYSRDTTRAYINGLEFRQLPFIRNYKDGRGYFAEKIIDDIVNYIKETGIKK